MNDARIAELFAPFLNASPNGRELDRPNAGVLSPEQLQHISTYINILLSWNARINLTAVREPEKIVTRHFGESLFAARHLFPAAGPGIGAVEPGSSLGVAQHVIDVGSGAGFPGLPIKIWAPRLDLTLIESSQKKATFLREVVRNLQLTGVEVFAGRAEAYSGPKAQVGTLRAVEQFESILPVAAGLVASGGRLAMLIGELQLKWLQQLAPSLSWSQPVRLPLSSNRVMIIGSKEP
jgi:16S rRNA (guanine527-N7)-methyltransferase